MFQILVDTPSAFPLAPTGSASSFLPIIAAAVVVILFIAAISVVRSRWQRPELANFTPEEIRARWEEIMKTSQQGQMGTKLALIEADKLLDNVLKSMMIPGETLGERLKMAAYKYPNITKIWPAHKLRNQLVHDTSFELRSSEAKRALSDFHDAFRTLRIL